MALVFLLSGMAAVSAQEHGTAQVAMAQTDVPGRHLYLKSNAIGWGLGVANISAEIDVDTHWTFALPVYWSAWNYFKSTVKVRTLTFQPEMRYWFDEGNEGWYAGVHFGMGWYNFATGGKYRTQDHGAHHPALGGGVSGGYRIPLGHSDRWKVEFSAGIGVYGLHYDKFYNEPDGVLADTGRKAFFGIDQLAVSFIYVFDLDRGGRSR